MTVIAIIFLLVGLALLLGYVNVDERAEDQVWDGGSSDIAFGFTQAKHVAATGDPSAPGGWISPSFQMESAYGPDRDSEEVKDEADNLLKVRISRDEFIITTTFAQSTARVHNLLSYLEKPANAVPSRYPLPINDPTTGETDPNRSQWILLYKTTVRLENWSVTVQNNADRTREVTFVGSKDDQGRIYEIVELPNDTSDAEWAPYSEFIDTAFP